MPVTATGQLSCSCPTQKSKNFVSSGEETTALRSVVLPAWDLEELAGPVSTPPAPVLAPMLERPVRCKSRTSTVTRFNTKFKSPRVVQSAINSHLGSSSTAAAILGPKVASSSYKTSLSAKCLSP